MRVFNLADKQLVYKGKTIPPNGGSAEFPDVAFLHERDTSNHCLAFGSLPKGWKPKGMVEAELVASKAGPAPVPTGVVFESMEVAAPPGMESPKEGKRNRR